MKFYNLYYIASSLEFRVLYKKSGRLSFKKSCRIPSILKSYKLGGVAPYSISITIDQLIIFPN